MTFIFNNNESPILSDVSEWEGGSAWPLFLPDLDVKRESCSQSQNTLAHSGWRSSFHFTSVVAKPIVDLSLIHPGLQERERERKKEREREREREREPQRMYMAGESLNHCETSKFQPLTRTTSTCKCIPHSVTTQHR